jgi:hypothetical protein
MPESHELRTFLLNLANKNYYNATHDIIRVEHPTREGRYFDVYFNHNIEVPNPSQHRVILFATEDILGENNIISDERIDLLPGQLKNGSIAKIPTSIAMLVNMKQLIRVSSPQTGSTGFSLSKINMFDEDKIRISISPPIDKTYTNQIKNESDDNPIGIFINDDSVMIRTRGGSITLADEGIHFGGKIYWESTKHGKEIMMDNPLHGIIPQTIPSAIISIPQIPNFNMIAQIADGALKVIDVLGKVTKISKMVG